jgi:hypothetical protein
VLRPVCALPLTRQFNGLICTCLRYLNCSSSTVWSRQLSVQQRKVTVTVAAIVTCYILTHTFSIFVGYNTYIRSVESIQTCIELDSDTRIMIQSVPLSGPRTSILCSYQLGRWRTSSSSASQGPLPIPRTHRVVPNFQQALPCSAMAEAARSATIDLGEQSR